MSKNKRQSGKAEFHPAFKVCQPEKITSPFVFNSPHSGQHYPKSFLNASRLDKFTLRKSEDSFVEELFDHVSQYGAPLLHAHFPRAYLDVNREPYELDPELFSDVLPSYANTKSVRVVGGLGTIARVVTESEEIYRKPLSLADAMERINQIYMPYHSALQTLINQSTAEFGLSVLIDCHSMPSAPIAYHSEIRPDFVLGDRFGTSCNKELTCFVEQELHGMGYVVALNKPYAGGFITEYYGQPANRTHAIQIEVNRALYMNEDTFTKSSGFTWIKKDLEKLTQRMLEEIPARLNIPPIAAE